MSARVESDGIVSIGMLDWECWWTSSAAARGIEVFAVDKELSLTVVNGDLPELALCKHCYYQISGNCF
jgi:hypothetical protein